MDVDARFARSHAGLREGPYVQLSVADTGSGMDETTQQRIFDPFFTTKGVDRGTGMGLAVVHGIVTDHDGIILVESAPGRGSKFEVYLPVCRDAALAAADEPVASS